MAAPLPRSVKILGLVSLLTDASSEMIYPLLPAFLTGALKAGPAFLGVVEGLAEALAAFVKIGAGGPSPPAAPGEPGPRARPPHHPRRSPSPPPRGAAPPRSSASRPEE